MDRARGWQPGVCFFVIIMPNDDVRIFGWCGQLSFYANYFVTASRDCGMGDSHHLTTIALQVCMQTSDIMTQYSLVLIYRSVCVTRAHFFKCIVHASIGWEVCILHMELDIALGDHNGWRYVGYLFWIIISIGFGFIWGLYRGFLEYKLTRKRICSDWS